jgi:general secretion pathway protein D
LALAPVSAVQVTQYKDYISTPSTKQGILLGASISLLQDDGAANLLSEPSVLCVNNQESTIYVGKNVPIQTTQQMAQQTTSLPTTTYTRQDIGLTLKVKPRLTSDNKVTLTVDATLEDIDPGSTEGLYKTTKRQVKSVAIVVDGETVIIGGLIRNNFRDQESKIPLLGDIPVLGNLFSWHGDSDEKINLVILLTPYIVNSAEDLTGLRQKLFELDQIQDQYVKNIKKQQSWLDK